MIGRGLGPAISVVVIDQLSKHLVLSGFGVPECTPQDHGMAITAFFDIALTCNRGMSFGMFDTSAGLSVPLFSVAAVAIVAVLLFWLSRVRSDILSIAIGLIVGGALGNVIDRLWGSHAVIDFLYFHLGTWFRYPAFNIADSAICIGVAIMLIEGLFSRREGMQAKEEGDRLP
jgi:signal peptidase II